MAASHLTACSNGTQRQDPTDNRGNQDARGDEGLLVARDQVPGYLASMTGLLTTRDGCVVLDNGRTAYVLVWPAGTTFTRDRGTIVMSLDDGTRAPYSLGRNYSLVGGGISHVDGSSAGFEPPGNAACKGQAWVVSATRSRDGGS